MNTQRLKLFLFLATMIVMVACSNAPAPVTTGSNSGQANSATQAHGELKFRAPASWVPETTTSGMRIAQYKLPRAQGDSDDAQLVLYYFGAGQGGTVDANLERWVGQMEQPDGRPSKEKATTETKTVNGLKVTLLDVTGTYTAEMSPGSGTRHNNTGYRMRAAVIETPKGPYFAKLVGPAATIAGADSDFRAYVESFEFK